MPLRLPRSIRARLIGATALWTVASLLVSGVFLSEAFRLNAERGLRATLTAHGYNAIGALSRDGSGRLVGSPDLGDPRFLQPFSGWYWAVLEGTPAATPATTPAATTRTGTLRMASPSLGGATLALPTPERVPFTDFTRTFRTIGPGGEPVEVREAQILVDEGQVPVSVVVAGAAREVDRAVDAFRRTLALFFGLFGLGLVAATAVIVAFALRPLARIRQQLEDIRLGEREAITGEQPSEVAPLVREVNALIAANRDIVERARRQVGNLAHALKTPLAVIRNEADAAGTDTVREQVDEMRRNVDTYLNRARIAAVRDTAAARAPVAPVAEGLARVLSRLHPRIDFAVDVPDAAVFAGERQDVEEVLGNLMENAARFAGSAVTVEAELADDLVMRVRDDGPGMSEGERARATQRGVRLDETRSQSGLGLSIVHDVVEAYGGALHFGAAPEGGLAVTVRLPRAAAAT